MAKFRAGIIPDHPFVYVSSSSIVVKNGALYYYRLEESSSEHSFLKSSAVPYIQFMGILNLRSCSTVRSQHYTTRNRISQKKRCAAKNCVSSPDSPCALEQEQDYSRCLFFPSIVQLRNGNGTSPNPCLKISNGCVMHSHEGSSLS